MKEINLTQDKKALIDDDDYSRIARYRWYYQSPMGYARAWIEGKRVYMHRLIFNVKQKEIQVDHINGNKLDNRKENLRIATPSQNQANKPKTSKKCSSRYRGVCYEPTSTSKKKWRAMAMENGTSHYLGHFTTEQEAALAYNAAAKKFYGDYAKINQI